MFNRLIRLGDSISQLLNVLLFNGHPNESLSGRAWRTQSEWYKVIDFVLWFDKDHCKKSHENDIDYAKQLIGLS
jgi:hypothetical protein